MQHIYRRTSTPKCDFNKVAKQLYWNHISAWVFPYNLLHIFRTSFLKNTSGWLVLWILGCVSSKQRYLSFLLRRQFSLFDFPGIRAIIHVVGQELSSVKSKCRLNSMFVLLEKLYQYLATFIIRDVFRTLSNMMELLVKIRYVFYLHHFFLTRLWIRLWSWYSIFFNQTSLQSLVFL